MADNPRPPDTMADDYAIQVHDTEHRDVCKPRTCMFCRDELNLARKVESENYLPSQPSDEQVQGEW